MTLEKLIERINSGELSMDKSKELVLRFLQEQKDICSLYAFPGRYQGEAKHNIKNCWNAYYLGIADDIVNDKVNKNYIK